MTPQPIRWLPGPLDTLAGCLRVVDHCPAPSPAAILRSCGRCGCPLWTENNPPPVEPGGLIHYLCAQCLVDVTPPDVVIGISPETRANLERRYGPHDWDQLAREMVALYRHAD